MDYIEQFKGKFTLIAWSYHHQSGKVAFRSDKNTGHDDVTPGPGRDRFFDTAASLGVDVMIDFHNHADEIHKRGMKLLILASVCPDSANNPMGPIHWGYPAVDGNAPYGNTAQLAWYETHFGKHPAVIGYCLNDACTPCPENEIMARWLMENAPDKIRYVSYGQPKTQDGTLFPVASFLNFSFAQDKTEGRSRHDCFVAIARSAKMLAERQGCKLWWPIIPASCPNRYIADDEIQFQIEHLREAGADGVVLFPFGTWFNEYVPEKRNGHIGGAIKQAVQTAKRLRHDQGA